MARRILVVQKKKEEAELVAGLDSLEEVEWERATTTVEALAAVKKQPTDLVIFGPGVEEVAWTCRRLKERIPDLALLAVIEERKVRLAVELMKAGVTDILVADDMTEEELEEAVRGSLGLRTQPVSEERYLLAVRGASDGLWTWFPKTDALSFSPRVVEDFGWGAGVSELTLAAWLEEDVHPDDRSRVRRVMEEHVEGDSETIAVECRVRHESGFYRWFALSGAIVREVDGAALRVAGSLRDITDKKTEEEHLRYNAYYDDLTDIPNRVLLSERIERALAKRRSNEAFLFAVLFLDLDDFKEVNDTLGHEAGDELLRLVAQRLETCIRPNDTVARIGGDEFAILLEDIQDPSFASTVAARIEEEMRHPVTIREEKLKIGATIGIAVSMTDYEEPGDILRDADTAMYRAKKRGKGGYEIFDPTMRQHVVAKWKAERQLRRAVERGEFRVAFQPMVEMASGRIRGFEALLRWEHPERGLLLPLDFLSLAERTGLIRPIGRFVLQEACRCGKEWNERFAEDVPFFMSVNISRRQFRQRDLVQEIEEILVETEFDASFLKLELTEAIVMEHIESATTRLLRLRGSDIALCLDNFGAGTSSLTCLHRFPLEMIKIDRSFARDLDTGKKRRLVESLITMAANLELDLVVEGIEKAEQYHVLQRMDCAYGQGNFFTPPLNEEEMKDLLKEQPIWTG